MTPEQMRDEYLRAIADAVRYWLAEDRAPTAREKLNGLAFSILVMLDGGSMAVPGCSVVPNCDEGGWNREEVAGGLHEHGHRFQPKEGGAG